jgi:hypothetical protein
MEGFKNRRIAEDLDVAEYVVKGGVSEEIRQDGILETP